jgi:hypothetical protein
VVISHGHIVESWRAELEKPRSISDIVKWRVETTHQRISEMRNEKLLLAQAVVTVGGHVRGRSYHFLSSISGIMTCESQDAST